MSVTQSVLQKTIWAKELTVAKDDSWIHRLYARVDVNDTPDLIWDEEWNRYKGLPRDKSNLTNLHIEANQLTELPSEIGLLPNLTHIDLTDKQLTELPKEIFDLPNLYV